ncbi:MAG TPA: hypothetical protein VJ550_02120 [Geomonas sp.]|nr:hypothetical protein [Geomonas sp.]
MKILLATILMLLVAMFAWAMDSELALFDEAQHANERFEEREIEAWKQIDNQSAQYHQEWKKVYDIDWKRDRLIFIFKLENEPETIDWKNLAWMHPTDSSEKTRNYRSTSQEYKELTAQMEKQISKIRTLKAQLKRRNELYEMNKDTFDKLESGLLSEQQSLQKRMDVLRRVQGQHPAADGLRQDLRLSGLNLRVQRSHRGRFNSRYRGCRFE